MYKNSLTTKLFKLSAYIILIILSTSCISSKKLALRDQMFRTETKLGIELSKRDKLELFVECSNWIGTPYKHGGMSINGADCSGFTNAIYKSVYNKNLERNSHQIYKKNCRRIYKRSLKPGDLVFFRSGSSRKIDHVGIYLKDNRFIHAATRGGVRVDNLNDKHYRTTFYRAGRVF